ncbi:beta-propeller fold lactonase family protein [Candidatus Dependentiae bacterium]|nr:beta-propeller fold lactonase family protein [Candidatus Dependentiae bacterium]
MILMVLYHYQQYTGLAFSPDGNCVVVANFFSNTLTVLTRAPNTCNFAITATVVGSVANGLSNPSSVAISQNGCVIVTNSGSNTVSVFTLIGVNDICTLAFVGVVPTGGTGPTASQFTSDGNCLIVANFNSNNLSVFQVDPNCVLQTPATLVGTGGLVNPNSIALSPDNRCIAVGNSGANTIAQYSITEANNVCTVTALPTSPLQGANLAIPRSVIYSTDGGCLFAANQGSVTGVNGLSIFRSLNSLIVTVTPSSEQTRFYTIKVNGAVPGNTVIVYDNGNIIGIGIAENDGSFTLTLQLSVGNHNITAAQKSTTCCTGDQSAAVALVVS